MSLYKSLSRFTTIVALIACGTATTLYAADEAINQPGQPGQTGGAGAYLSDSAITAKVKTALISNKLSGISVTTELGVVALSGFVKSEELRQQATKIASNVDGVRGVDYTGLSIKMGS